MSKTVQQATLYIQSVSGTLCIDCWQRAFGNSSSSLYPQPPVLKASAS